MDGRPARSRKFRFTKTAVAGIASAPLGKRDEYCDTEDGRLRLRVTDKGAKTYCVLARVRGGPMERVTIGSASALTPDQARTRAIKVLAGLKAGESQNAIQRTKRGEVRFHALFADYIDRHAKINKRSWQDDLGVYRRYLDKPLGRRRLTEVDRESIARMHSTVSKFAPVQANRALALVSSVFAWAASAGLWRHVNPASGIRKNREVGRRRYLQPPELARFFAALEKINANARDFFLIAILTGARRSNVEAMRWYEIDLNQAIWQPARSKNDERLTIPLVDETIEVLTRRRREAPMSAEWVFPSHGKSGHIVEPKKAWDKMRRLADLGDLRIHDLRRTMGSWLVRTGASTTINAKALGHKSLQAAAVYQRIADTDPVRDAITKATRGMLDAGGRGQAVPAQSAGGK